jgi:hypothetical protein
VQISPLLDAAVVEKVFLTKSTELIARLAAGFFDRVPPPKPSGEVGSLVSELAMRTVSSLLLLARSLARILNGESTGDN